MSQAQRDRETKWVGSLLFFMQKMNHRHRSEDLICLCLIVLPATYTCKRKMPLLQIHLLGVELGWELLSCNSSWNGKWLPTRFVASGALHSYLVYSVTKCNKLIYPAAWRESASHKKLWTKLFLNISRIYNKQQNAHASHG